MARQEVVEARKNAGGRQISASFTVEEVALLDRARERGGHKTNKAAILAGLKALEANAPTPEQALEVLGAFVRGKPARRSK